MKNTAALWAPCSSRAMRLPTSSWRARGAGARRDGAAGRGDAAVRQPPPPRGDCRCPAEAGAAERPTAGGANRPADRRDRLFERRLGVGFVLDGVREMGGQLAL